jgi:hypothetical protein
MKVVYKPTKQSNAIGLASLGFAILFTTVGLYRWKIAPFLRHKRAMQDEEWADFIFEREQKLKVERDEH